MSTKITKCTNTANTTYKTNRSIKYLVIHYTAGTRSTVGTAKGNALYFAKPSTGASADFIVDDGSIVQYNPDIKNRYCWSVGGTKYNTKYTSQSGKYYNLCNNSNCINVEMCSNKKNTKTLNATDTDWYFTEATINNTIELAKELMKTYNISIDNVIMHHQVTGKICPNPFCLNESRLSEWNKFKERIKGENNSSDKKGETKAFKFIELYINSKKCTYTGFTENNENWVKVSAVLQSMGYSVKWNGIKKRVIAVKDGKETLLDIRTYISADSISFCPVRDLFEYLGYNVEYDIEKKIINVRG